MASTRFARRFVAVLAILLAVSGLAFAANPTAAAALPDPAGAEAQFLSLLNQARSANGALPPLAIDANLQAVAQDWSTRMSATFDANGNVTVDPAAPADCAKSALCHRPDLRQAVDAASPGWLGAGENIGVGGDVQALHDGFMGSTGHRANILGDYDRVGIAVVASGTRLWVTFDFVKGTTPIVAPAGSTPVADPAAGTAVDSLATGGKFTAAVPQRVVDTRSGLGAPAAVPAGGSLTVAMAGTGQVPADATGVVVNVTATGAAADGYLTLYPCGATAPTSSTLNFTAGSNVPNLATSALGSNGALCVFSNVNTNVLVDLAGWYRTDNGASFTGQTPNRILDTRNAGGATQAVTINLAGQVAAGTKAVAVNITATEPAAAGYVTAYPCGSAVPATSNVNFTAGGTVANAAVVPLAADGTICLAASAPTQLIVDIAGAFAGPGTTMTAVTPARILDTRNGVGGWLGRLATGQTIELPVAGRAGIPTAARSAVFNVTVTQSDKGGYLTVYPCGTPVPVASNVNFNAGETRANQVTVDLGTSGKACFYSNNATSVIADLTGYLS